MKTDFREALLDWYSRSKRDLPWRRTSDPYAIWVSEIMLQQTRVAAVVPFYERFLRAFPSIDALANAPDAALLAGWAGLGYYSRVRNMQRAARQMNGCFPADYESIRALPGIGEYTAAAIASIAFGLPYAAVDGNVLRVLSRVCNDAGDISTASVRQRIALIAGDLLDRRDPGEFNQGMMELGATICLPRDPQCLLCPVANLCQGRAVGAQNVLPVTRKRAPVVRIHRTVFVAERDDAILMWQRGPESPKLAGFWELPEPEHFTTTLSAQVIGKFRHSITNHQYTFEVAVVRAGLSPACKQVVNYAWIARNSLGNMALSTTARKALALYEGTRRRQVASNMQIRR